jgi:hypothetical protein
VTLDQLSSRLEEFDRISVRIVQLDLPAAGTSLHLIAKPHSRVFQDIDHAQKVAHSQNDAVPSSRRLSFAASLTDCSGYSKLFHRL